MPDNVRGTLIPSYNKDPIRKNMMYWWIGQVVDEEHWIGNESLATCGRDDIPGWGKRYRVRIFSRDSHIKDENIATPDKQLQMADVIAPVTAGSGHGGYGETVALAQGSFVMGFYLDGEEGRQPVIIGCLPNHPETRLFGGDPSDGFVPRSGFRGNTGNKQVATKDLHTEPGSIAERESSTSAGNVDDARRKYQKQDGQEVGVRKKNIECEGGGGPVKGIQGFIQRALALIKRIKDEAKSFLGAASDIIGNINNVIDSTVSFITSMIKLIIGKMRGYVFRKINAGIKDLADKLPPNLRQFLSNGSINATDTLGCAFQNIIKGLYNLVKNLFLDLIDRYINAPMCAAEKFIADIIGSVLGDITSAIDDALGAIEGLFDIVGSIIDGVFDVLDIISGLLNFLKCDTTPNCDYRDRWSFWNGDSEAKNVSEGLGNLLRDVSNGIQETIPNCSTDQLPCGPPSIEFNGGGGFGMSANPIVSSGGQILGIDFNSFGQGYTSLPSVSIVDQCNNGGGARIELITNDEGSVTGAVVLEPGSGYLPSVSKNQTTISNPGETIYRSPSGEWEVYPPGQVINVPNVSTDTDPYPVIYPPLYTEVPIVNTETDDVVDTVTGQGPLIPIKIPTGVTFTTPEPLEDSSTITDDRPIVDGRPENIILDGVYIENPGVNYNLDDEIIITPSNGVEMSPIFNDVGSIVDIVITNPGSEFKEYPRINVKSELGVNANIIPIFKVKAEDEEESAAPIVGDRIITVDDCVGKILVGYINGKPYYGPYHYSPTTGKKIVGDKHTSEQRPYIYDTPEESLRYQYLTRQ